MTEVLNFCAISLKVSPCWTIYVLTGRVVSGSLIFVCSGVEVCSGFVVGICSFEIVLSVCWIWVDPITRNWEVEGVEVEFIFDFSDKP